MNAEDKIIQKLIEMDKKMDGLATNERIDKLEGRILDILDKQGVILQRLDQERLFTIEWIKRIEADVTKIKQHLQLA